MKWTRLLAAGVLALSSVASRASAQPRDGTDRAVAAFEEARALIDAGHCDQALPKLKESLALHASIGAHLSIADCTEQSAPLDAWQHLVEAARLAYMNHDDRLAVAESRARELAKRLPTLRIEFAGDELHLAGLELRLDGVRVEPFAYRDGIMATTEGEHVLDVTAPNRAFSQRVTTTRATSTTVRVALRDTTPEPVVPPPTHAQAPIARDVGDASTTQRTMGFVVGGVGVGGIVLGSIFGAVTLAKKHDMQSACGGDLSHCSASPQVIEETRSSARTTATVATASFAGGAIAIVAGLVLVLASPTSTPARMGRLTLAPTAGPHGAGMTLVQPW